MLQKSARIMLAAVLAISLCPAMALADDASESEGTGNPLADLFYQVVGYESDDADTTTNSSGLYPNTLTAPPASTTLPDLATATDYVNGGLLVGTAGDLYYMREATFTSGDVNTYAYKTFECYNPSTDSWKTLESLPEWLEGCSVAVFDSAIIVSGISMVSDGATPSHSSNPEARMYSYDPLSEYPSWTEISTAGVPAGAGVVNNGGLLEVVGGLQGGSFSSAISTYEPSVGVGESVGQLASGVVGAKVVPHNGDLYVYACGNSLTELQSGAGSPRLQVVEDGVASDISSGLPLIETYVSGSGFPSVRSALYGGLTSCVDGLIIVGPTAQAGNADTYILPWLDQTYAAYNLRADSNSLCGTAACVYLDKLYALGSTISSSGEPVLSFRSTAMEDAVLLSGNNGVWRQGSDQPLVFVFSPDYGRFSYKVAVDGTELSMGSDYQSSTGSTYVTLMPNLLSTLSMGSHTVSAFFDDSLTEVSGTFTVETTASSIAEGYTRPASLAMTSDSLPAGPIAVVSIVALSVALVAFQKKSSQKF